VAPRKSTSAGAPQNWKNQAAPGLNPGGGDVTMANKAAERVVHVKVRTKEKKKKITGPAQNCVSRSRPSARHRHRIHDRERTAYSV